MRHDGGVVARRTGNRSTVADFLLDVAHDGTFGHLADGEAVANSQVRCNTQEVLC